MIITQNSHVNSHVDGTFFYVPDGLVIAMEHCSASTHIVLLPVEPYLAHAYWEIAAVDLKRAQEKCDTPWTLRPVLRIYDVSPPCDTPRHVLDIDVKLHTPKCYVPLSTPAGAYVAELGLLSAHGQFVLLASSNTAHLPRAWPAEPSVPSIPDHPTKTVRPFPLAATAKAGAKQGGPFVRDDAANPLRTFNTVNDILHKGASDLISMNEAIYTAGISSGQTVHRVDEET